MKQLAFIFIMLSFIFVGYSQTFADSSSGNSVAGNAVPQQEMAPFADEAKPAAPAAPAQAEQKPAEQQQVVAEPESSEAEKEEEKVTIADPLYPWNKAMYHFNDKLYFWVLKPASKGYSAVIPEDMRIAVSNFFENVMTPIRFVSDILQLKIKRAGNELVRFAYNSTAGVCGLADAAKVDLNVPRVDEDLGQAFGHYGIGHGFYIVWPFLGPSSLRDSVGKFGDGFLNPVNYISPIETSIGITAYDEVNTTSLHIGDYEDLKKAAVDPYVSIRDAYLQYRKKKVEE